MPGNIWAFLSEISDGRALTGSRTPSDYCQSEVCARILSSSPIIIPLYSTILHLILTICHLLIHKIMNMTISD